MATTTSAEKKAAAGFTVIGTRPVRHDGLDKVTGRARYGADIHLPGLLHGRILRSPHAHARVRSVDTRRAEALEGVWAVATSSDFTIVQQQDLDVRVGVTPRMMADNDLAGDKVLYKGHAVAAVAAVSQYVAEEALALIEVDFEVLPPVMTFKDAMRDDAPLLHEGLRDGGSDEVPGGDGPAVRGNVASHIQLKRGDVEKGFEEADVIVERELTTEAVHQGYIEPFAATADWSEEGRLTIWTSTQGIFTVRTNTAAILGLPESVVKVVPMEIGGGFGGKGVGYLEPVAAVLSRKAGRPVKMVMTRQEVFEATGPASGSFMRCKIGATRDGRITAAQLYLIYEGGAYPGSSVGGGANSGLGPYRLDNMLVDGYDVVCNRPKTQAYRAPGHPQAQFAVETVIDELAEKLGMDPLDLRTLNAAREGDRAPNGVLHARFGCSEVEDAMKAHPHYTAPLGGPNRGRGVAVGYRFNGGGSGSSATVNVNSNGTVSLVTGSADLSGTRVAIAMQVAEMLGLPVDEVVPTVVDTDSVGFTGNSGGSRITFDTGRAALTASEGVIRQMAERAALIWEISPEDVEFRRGVFISGKDPEDRLSFKNLAGRLMETGGPVTASASDAQGGVGAQLAGNIADVEVDPETGKVDVLRYTTFLDVGQAVHPSYVEGQMQGGALQGIGWALNEEYFYNEDGTMANSTFLDYRMPTTLDLPMIDTVILEVTNPRHPFGIRGVGEAPLVPPLAALANAVHAATGVRMTRLPMTPAAIREAMTAGVGG
jgi:CO/xanthine dehydrogenase Mo-binding subunit